MKPSWLLAVVLALVVTGLSAAADKKSLAKPADKKIPTEPADPMPPAPAGHLPSTEGLGPDALGKIAANGASYLAAAMRYHKAMQGLEPTTARKKAVADNWALYESERLFFVRVLDQLRAWAWTTSIDGAMTPKAIEEPKPTVVPKQDPPPIFHDPHE